jgi:serine/threonine protein kinase
MTVPVGAPLDPVRVLSRGAMTVVYEAVDASGQRVAIKRLRPEWDRDPSAVRRILNEAKVTRSFGGQGAPFVYSSPSVGAGFVMEFMDAGTLRDALAGDAVQQRRQPRLPEFRRALASMAHAHGRGLVHGDLKPANVAGAAGFERVVVLDWGLCVPDRPHGAGTPLYMAPEQANTDSAPTSAASDVYALGLILFEVLTEKRARIASDFDGALAVARTGNLEPLTHRRADVAIDEVWKGVVMRATARAPEDRFADAAEFLRATDGARAREPWSFAP